METLLFWDITPFIPSKVKRCFGRKYCLHLQGCVATYFSYTPFDFLRTIWRYVSGDGTIHSHRCEKIFFCEAIGTAATPGLLCQPRVIVKMIVEKQIKCRLAGETEVLGKNLPRRHFCPSQNPTSPDPGLNPGRRVGKPATNRLSYGAAKSYITDDVSI
jgi:hypothetical protein